MDTKENKVKIELRISIFGIDHFDFCAVSKAKCQTSKSEFRNSRHEHVRGTQ